MLPKSRKLKELEKQTDLLERIFWELEQFATHFRTAHDYPRQVEILEKRRF